MMLLAPSRGCTLPSKALTGVPLVSSTMLNTTLKKMQPALGVWRAPDRDWGKVGDADGVPSVDDCCS